MNHMEKEMILSGRVTNVSRCRFSLDQGEQVTFTVDDAVPLWAEVRLPNSHGWVVGDLLSISIVCEKSKTTREAA
jgi:hypothetical protein